MRSTRKILTVFIVLCALLTSNNSNADFRNLHVVIGEIAGSYVDHYSAISEFALWFRQNGVRVIVHFMVTEKDLTRILQSKDVSGVVWVGHSFLKGGLQGSDGKLISLRTFEKIHKNVRFLALGACCAKSAVIDYYGLRETYPDLKLFYFPTEDGLIRFSTHIPSLFRSMDVRQNFLSLVRSSVQDSCSKNLSVSESHSDI